MWWIHSAYKTTLPSTNPCRKRTPAAWRLVHTYRTHSWRNLWRDPEIGALSNRSGRSYGLQESQPKHVQYFVKQRTIEDSPSVQESMRLYLPGCKPVVWLSSRIQNTASIDPGNQLSPAYNTSDQKIININSKTAFKRLIRTTCSLPRWPFVVPSQFWCGLPSWHGPALRLPTWAVPRTCYIYSPPFHTTGPPHLWWTLYMKNEKFIL